jgi:hypothetical protein
MFWQTLQLQSSGLMTLGEIGSSYIALTLGSVGGEATIEQTEKHDANSCG